MTATARFCFVAAVLFIVVEGLEGFDSVKESPRNLAPRNLESNDGYFVSYLVDKNGVEYEPYSLAWRYLGMYIDCDIDAISQQQEDEERMLENDNDDDDSNSCERKLLWAAYYDPRYKGGSIGEYQFYDLDTHEWDKSTCETRRCAKMDCHLPNTHYKLVGVFKETDGLYDWGEQLFKHEGYCAWNDEDKYELMQEHLEDWPSYCISLSYPDDDGNSLYWHMLPQAEGNMTMGIFTDEYCTQVSNTTSFSDYVIIYYYNYYGSNDYGTSQAESWEYSIEKWNEYMDTWRICQPCRAYSKSKNSDGGNERKLGDENDGEGDEEQWGYNCYDDAGYTNCNQCYKFETKTSLEPATTDDLVRASKQGSLLRIKVNGRVYGSGGIGLSEASSPLRVIAIVLGVGMLVGGIVLVAVRYRFLKRKLKAALPASFREKLDNTDNNAESSTPRRCGGGGGICLLFTILSQWWQRKLCATGPCSTCPGDESIKESIDDDSDNHNTIYLPPVD